MVNNCLRNKLSLVGAAAAYAESAVAYADAAATYADATAAYADTMKTKPNSLELSLQAVRVLAKYGIFPSLSGPQKLQLKSFFFVS